MRKNHKYFRQAVFIFLFLIIYSSFSDCYYTDKTPEGTYSLLTYTQNSSDSSFYGYYYHLLSTPLEENYANLMLKVPNHLITYRPGTISGMIHIIITDTASMQVLLAALLLKFLAMDKPMLYFFLPLRGHAPPK